MWRMPPTGWQYAASAQPFVQQSAMDIRSSSPWSAPRKSVILPLLSNRTWFKYFFPFLTGDTPPIHYMDLEWTFTVFTPSRKLSWFSNQVLNDYNTNTEVNFILSQEFRSAAGTTFPSSCGACRQFMAEFGNYLCKCKRRSYGLVDSLWTLFKC